MAMVMQNEAKLAEQARLAFRELLSERPEFMDTSRYSINDVVPFLEQEEGFPDWLSQYEGNMRALSSVWNQTAKQMKQATPPAPPIIAKPVETVKEVKPKATPIKKPVATPTPSIIQEATQVLESQQMVVAKEELSPAVLEEQALQQSRALAEQFAIVKHHEIALKQATSSIEEATEALNRARQNHFNATTAYSNALEDLARMMASSLGIKATEFSKLIVKAASGDTNKPKN